MTSTLADISAWEGHIVPGRINPAFRQGITVNFKGENVSQEKKAPQMQIQQPKKGLGDDHLIKQLVSVLQKSQTAPMQEALPQYRRL